MRLLAFFLGLSALAVVATVAAVSPNGPALPSPRRKTQRSTPLKNRLPQARRRCTALAYPIAFSIN
jgi:hypothetical protein